MMGDAKDCDTCEYEHELVLHPACAGCVGGNWKPKPETVRAERDTKIAELEAHLLALIAGARKAGVLVYQCDTCAWIANPKDFGKKCGVCSGRCVPSFSDNSEPATSNAIAANKANDAKDKELAAMREALEEASRDCSSAPCASCDRAEHCLTPKALAADAGKAVTEDEIEEGAAAEIKRQLTADAGKGG